MKELKKCDVCKAEDKECTSHYDEQYVAECKADGEMIKQNICDECYDHLMDISYPVVDHFIDVDHDEMMDVLRAAWHTLAFFDGNEAEAWGSICCGIDCRKDSKEDEMANKVIEQMSDKKLLFGHRAWMEDGEKNFSKSDEKSHRVLPKPERKKFANQPYEKK